MATILIIDENSDKIKKQIDGLSGIYTFVEENIQDAEKVISEKQFDVILCQVSFKMKDIELLLNLLSTHQPSECRFYWLAFENEQDTLEHLCNNHSNSFFIKPLMKTHIESLYESKLLDQADIDSLFS